MTRPLQPPRLARRVLRRLCAPAVFEEIDGDLAEEFAAQVHCRGLLGAQCLYWWNVLLVATTPRLRHCPTPTYSYQQAQGPIMLTNYVKIALRNFKRHTGYTFITVSGLAVGLACCLLIFLFVHHALRFDRFHAVADRIYRVYDDVALPSGETNAFSVSAYVGPEMTEAFPEIESYARFASARSSFVFEHEGRYFQEENLLYADSTALTLFSFPLLRGNPATALAAPYSIVLTESTARKYFGNGDAIGQVLTPSAGNRPYTVTGILADVPTTSHLQFDGLISMATAIEARVFYFQDLLDLRFATFFLLREDASAAALEAKFPDFVERRLGDIQRESNIYNTFGLVALPDVYLHDAHRGLGKSGSRSNLYTFSAIALLTLLIACINFTNLATARSAQRAKEVGVRKVVGARRLQLAGQFLGESVLLSLGALGIAMLLAALFLPAFNALAETTLSLMPLTQPGLVLAVLGGVVLVGLLAGSYPALVLSGFRPVAVLKGRFFTSAGGSRLRKTLVVFQFGISVVLIVGTGIVYQQVRFMQRQELGFHTEQMLVIDFRGDSQVRGQIDVLKQEMRRVPGVQDVTASNVVPSRLSYTALALAEAADGSTREVMMPVFPVDFDFAEAYGLEVVAGRAFSPDFATDSTAFLLNEAATRELGYASPEEALGASIREWGQQGEVVGVVRDFHYTSLQRGIEPINFLIGVDNARFLTLRIGTSNLRQTISEVEVVWQRLAPHRPLEYSFLDEAFDAQYREQQRFGQIVGAFALLAILVACLGLFGLAAFMAQRRTKEIGIRKVLGASLPDLVTLLSKEFTVLVVIATLLSAPVAYLVMNDWLDDFAYRIEISGWIFLLAGLAALLVAWLTVSYQAVKAALADPVKTLRYE